MKKRYEKASKKDLEEFDAQYREGFDEMYNASTIASKSLKDTKKKTDIMQKVREQTALLKKKKQEKEFEDKIHKGLNDSAAAYDQEISKLEKQVSGIKQKIKPAQQSTADFLKMSFTPPKRDIVEMMTPNKDKTSTAIIPYRENKSLLDFAIGGSPAKTKTAQDLKEEKMKVRLSELKKKEKLNAKELFELNDVKSHFTAQPNPNSKVAGSMITKAIKNKIARKDFKNAKDTYDPLQHQENIRDKRKEFARIITTKTTSPQAKEEAQRKFKKTNYVFKRKSNAGRPSTNTYSGLKQTNI